MDGTRTPRACAGEMAGRAAVATMAAILLLAAALPASAQEWYFITARHSGKCLHQHGGTFGNGDRITQWDCVEEPNVKLQKVPADGDTFFLRFGHSGKCVHLPGPSAANGTPITQWDCIDLPNVKWRQQDAGGGYVYLRSAATDKCIHQHIGTHGNGDPITQWDCVDEPNVQWLLSPTSPPLPANRNPTVRVTASATSCQAPCSITVAAPASDPDGDPLTYSWSGCASGAGPVALCHLPSPGNFTARVVVSDGRGGSASASRTLTGTAPQPTVGAIVVSLGFGASFPGCSYRCEGSGSVTITPVAGGHPLSKPYSFGGLCSYPGHACTAGVTFTQLPPGTWRIQDTATGLGCERDVRAGQTTTVRVDVNGGFTCE
jgi:hypothetical protein